MRDCEEGFTLNTKWAFGIQMSPTASRRPDRLKQTLRVGGHRGERGGEVRGSRADGDRFT